MTEPDLVHGAWTRRSVSIGDGAHFETQLVVWLQAGTRYADLRIPLHPAADTRCFTGRSGWDGDRYRWTHHLDLEPLDAASPGIDDIGDLGWEDDALVERGMWPTDDGPVAYEEQWVPLPGGRTPYLALEAPGCCLVRVGLHALTVTDRRPDGGVFSACYRVLDKGAWKIIAAIGEGAALPDPASPPARWRLIHQGAAESVSA
jgi:hypothetical protein